MLPDINRNTTILLGMAIVIPIILPIFTGEISIYILGFQISCILLASITNV